MHILISGAGVAGPTFAHWLLRNGHEPTLVERAPAFRAGGYMIDFWGVGFEVADRMGLVPQLREVGYEIDQLKFVDERGRIRSALKGNALSRVMGDRFISLPRGDLAETIFKTIADKCEVVFGDSITGLQDKGDHVEVLFERAAARRFDLVVGCDGLHSAVRDQVFGPSESFEKYLGYYAASFVSKNYPHREERSYLSFAAPGRQISRYALRGDRTAFLLVFAHDEKIAASVSATKAKEILAERFHGTGWNEWPEILARLECTDDLYFDSVSQIRMPHWSRGRVALIGDAAYAPSLLAGEGASFAMAGAYILAGELQNAGNDYARAFQQYEQRARPFIEAKQRSAENFAGSFTPRTHFGIFVRDLVLRLSSLPFVADWLMRRFLADRFDLPVYESR